ncbi:acyl-CoA N-acyltransferase [Calycina marina]|uniref:Acyl-CoA N-acyltransferase n=1 Tax=Calycina marina TaxID=1763456 RepID=A0A9P8CGS3_9HELO|nr:acyl-CoA N-acyltransferase [Calycina marina]
MADQHPVHSALPTELRYIQYTHSQEKKYLPLIRALIKEDLSEPYSIYVYRYFLYQWGDLCYMAIPPTSSFSPNNPAVPPSLPGVVVCKLEPHTSHSSPTLRGYIAMLAVSAKWRNHGIATELVKRAIDAMRERGADEVVLETEEENVPAMKLYERLGFLRSKKLHRYYLNGSSAYRLILHLKEVEDMTGDRRVDDMHGDGNMI